MGPVAKQSEVLRLAQSPKLNPVNPVVWVTSTGIEIIDSEKVTIDLVGEKAFGLASLPAKWTLPFFVISDKLFDDYVKKPEFEDLTSEWESAVIAAAMHCEIAYDDQIIVRSNAHSEGLAERGKFISVEGTFQEWQRLVKECFDDSLKHGNVHMLAIIQKRATALSSGHISNERRVAEEIRDWKGEVEAAIPKSFSVSLRNWRKKVKVDGYLNSPLMCPGDKVIKDVLSIPCTWATEQRIRVHFEWVYDGYHIYLVQADEETATDGINPMKSACRTLPTEGSTDTDFPYCVHRLKAEDANRYKQYAKIQNPLLYHRIKQSIAPLYILDDEATLEALAKGIITDGLEKDLCILTSRPLIIRTDIATYNKEERQLLPRTNGVRNVEVAKKWLCESYAELSKQPCKNAIFIMHNYIPAFSSAFAYASPGDQLVRIEALWGLPEGLYYYSHDKHLVDTKYSDIEKIVRENFEVQSFKNFKKYFVFPIEDEKWEVQCLASPFDWNVAIPEEDWVKEIAYVTRRISEAERKSISVMWFVGVDKATYGCDVFPWYHEPFEYNEKQTTPRNKLSFERTLAIHTLQELEQLEKMTQRPNASIRNIQIQPTDVNILRDRSIIDRIGNAAKALGANILLEGGVLSHAYYQLVRTGAKVEVRNAFEKKQSLEFNKLVRDKIPEKIQRNGEEAITAQLDKKILSRLLKRKLVEEALEVLDSEDDEALAIELADILEVLDGILGQHQIDIQTVLDQKKIKREKAGGFEKGVYLKTTSNRVASSIGKIIIDDKPVDTKQTVSKSTDLRKYSTANESLTRIKVPVTLDKWEIRPSVRAENIDIVIRGERKQGAWQIEISVFEEAAQMSFFDK